MFDSKFLLPLWLDTPSNARCHWTLQVASESVKPFKQGAQMGQTTDHAMEKCVRISGIVIPYRVRPGDTTTSSPHCQCSDTNRAARSIRDEQQ